jgi:trans-2-enoyl-CoA reductase
MVMRVLRPEGKGFLFLDAHPTGCARTVEEMIAEAPTPAAASERGSAVLVIGCSGGYGLAAAAAGLFGHAARTIGGLLRAAGDSPPLGLGQLEEVGAAALDADPRWQREPASANRRHRQTSP